MKDNCPSPVRLPQSRRIGSMRQISDLSSALESDNASTCGFFERKGRCGRGFRNLPHTSVLGLRKCGGKPRSAEQTPVLRLRDLRFCCRKLRYARWFPIFPRTSGNWAFYQRYAVPSSVKPREPSQGQLAKGRVGDPFWLPRYFIPAPCSTVGAPTLIDASLF